jgi:hypothetical protein
MAVAGPGTRRDPRQPIGSHARKPHPRRGARAHILGPAPPRGARRGPCSSCHRDFAVKPFICHDFRVQHPACRDSPSEPAEMSIRRDLLLRTTLLRLPDLAALKAAAAAKPADRPAPRRPAARKRRLRPVAAKA